MSQLSHPIFFTVFGSGAVVAALIGVFRWKQWKRRMAAWRSFADQRGLDFNLTEGFFRYAPGTLTMQGLYQDLPLLLFTEYRGSGKSRHLVTVLQLELGSTLLPGLTLKPEGLGEKVLKLFGLKDEEVGDEALDAAFQLKNVTARSRAMLLSPRVRGSLMRLGRAYSDFSIEAGYLRVEQLGMPETAEELDTFLSPALGLARALRATNGHPGSRERG